MKPWPVSFHGRSSRAPPQRLRGSFEASLSPSEASLRPSEASLRLSEASVRLSEASASLNDASARPTQRFAGRREKKIRPVRFADRSPFGRTLSWCTARARSVRPRRRHSANRARRSTPSSCGSTRTSPRRLPPTRSMPGLPQTPPWPWSGATSGSHSRWWSPAGGMLGRSPAPRLPWCVRRRGPWPEKHEHPARRRQPVGAARGARGGSSWTMG